MHERVYKQIMEHGTDQVKEHFQPILAELMIDVADIIDK